MEKAEWWQSPVVPVAFLGTIVLVLGYAVCGRSKPESPAEPAPAVVAAPASPAPSPVESAAPAVVEPVTKAEAAAMLAELHDLDKVGRAMASTRLDDDPAGATHEQLMGQRRCVDLMTGARPRLEKLFARLDGLPEGLFPMRLATSDLSVCLVCVKSGTEGCARARADLRDADAAMAKAKWLTH